MNEINALLNYQKKITDLQYTINVLSWDLRISTPAGAKDSMIELIGSYEKQLFDLTSSDEYGKLLHNVINSSEFKSLEEAEQRYIKKLYKNYEDSSKIPADFYQEYTELKNKTNMIWLEAKQNNDYQQFKPYLKKIIQMTKKYYRYIEPTALNIYDVMLNEYEEGMTSDKIDKLFEPLKKTLIPLIKEVSSSNISVYRTNYTPEDMLSCAKYLLDYIGFNIDKGKLGIFPHGFTNKICASDVRIALNYTDNPISSTSTIIHEGGHAIFEQNIKENLSKYSNCCLENGYGLHESQSRFYENILGRNINFWIPIYDEVKRLLKINLSLDEFMQYLNQVTAGAIRTEADELTYCLHIILRYEIEKDIFNNDLDLDKLPEVWNSKMMEYLGVKVENDAMGLMQDIHWSEGSFGYFPSYLLGTIYDGMYLKAIEKEFGNIDELLKNGKIKEITNYLCENIYKYGGAFTSQEIIEKLCGEELSIEPIIEYFNCKYKK